MIVIPNNRLIVGIVGHPSSGKDTVAEYLAQCYGFTHISTGNLVREYVRDNNLGKPSRQNLNRAATKLRQKNGAGFLAKLALQNPSPRLVISGIRTAAEAVAVKEAGGLIIAVTAPLKVRYERARQRGRVGEDISLPMFQMIEEKEAESADPNAQNVNAAIAKADQTLNNSGTLEDLRGQIDKMAKFWKDAVT